VASVFRGTSKRRNAYFGELLNGGTSAVEAKPAAKSQAPAPASQQAPAVQPKTTSIPSGAEAKPLTGASKKIVENMEQSLTVPTATSFRDLPVKLLEENRKIMNDRLQASGRGKASFTHLIGWAIVQAAKAYPAMNNGFGVVDGAPSRIQNHSINLGIAIDVEKRDGSRNLLVPNIKGCESMNFAEFFAAYN
jgi:multifunctional 2-oxoglutarate metabolism enzyme